MRILVACEESQTVCKWRLQRCSRKLQKISRQKRKRPKIRSKTFSGIAAAMAEQWGCLYD